MLTQGPIGKPHPEPGVLFALFQRVGSKHLFLGGGRDTARVGQPDSDTQESLFSEDREMDEREAMAPGRSRVGFCFPVCCGLSEMGVGGGKREEKRSLLRAWSLSFCYLVLFALVRLTESSFTSMTY